ncbi:hypothetical protein ABZT17_42755 [Streptomyces sp. NPDC005648]|uniref:hypothetical protein n=1 Tax=Streptomyces sp. NPDC005648 TaxID=3157044 RepID=UPI0033B85FCE
MSDCGVSDPWFAVATALFAWPPPLALCAAFHRDAPPADLPFATPGMVYTACCVVMGASLVLLPAVADSAWAPGTCFVLGALAWLLLRTRRPERGPDSGVMALAALGLLLLAVRVAAVCPWLGVLPAAFSAVSRGT